MYVGEFAIRKPMRLMAASHTFLKISLAIAGQMTAVLMTHCIYVVASCCRGLIPWRHGIFNGSGSVSREGRKVDIPGSSRANGEHLQVYLQFNILSLCNHLSYLC